MKLKALFNALYAIFITMAVSYSSAVFAATCPSDAICRNDITPGQYSSNGPYSYSSYSMPLLSTPGGATVYYPTSAQAPYSVLVFTPPYLGRQYMYAAWGPFFASHGIVLVTMDSRSIYDSVDSRATQQQDVLDAMKDENTRYSSPLYGKIDITRLGAMGWSMGGGATWITSANYSGLRSAMSLAGHNDTALNYFDSHGFNTYVPTMIFNGALDKTILGGLGQSDGVYANIPAGVPKAFYEVARSGHFDWGTPTQANNYVAEMALAFEKAYLDGDMRWAPFIERPPFDVSEYREANIPNN